MGFNFVFNFNIYIYINYSQTKYIIDYLKMGWVRFNFLLFSNLLYENEIF